MQGLYKAHGAAQTEQARRDYAYLLNIAAHHGLDELVPSAGERPGWRKLDKAAEVGIKALLNAKPELREKLREIYPGFVTEDLCQ